MNRRQFLWTPLAARALQALQNSVGAAMIGVGNRGAALLKAAMDQPNVRILALCDTKPDRLDKAATAAARDNPTTHSDYRRILDRKDVDAVYIATPCDLHVEMAIAALQAGKHVYCEKPVGITPESIARLVKVARESKTIFQVGQQMRAGSRNREAIAKIHEGIAGRIIMIKAQRHSSDDLPHDSPSADWFFDANRSGDVLVEMSVHNLDLCNWILNQRPQLGAGFGDVLLYKNTPPGRTSMDGYTLSYDYPGGAKLSYTQVFFHPRGMPGSGQYVYAYGTEGAVDLMDATFYPKKRDSKPIVLAPPRKEDMNAQHAADFFESIRTGKKPLADIEAGARGALTAILGREAIQRRRVVNWDELKVDL